MVNKVIWMKFGSQSHFATLSYVHIALTSSYWLVSKWSLYKSIVLNSYNSHSLPRWECDDGPEESASRGPEPGQEATEPAEPEEIVTPPPRSKAGILL